MGRMEYAAGMNPYDEPLRCIPACGYATLPDRHLGRAADMIRIMLAF